MTDNSHSSKLRSYRPHGHKEERQPGHHHDSQKVPPAILAACGLLMSAAVLLAMLGRYFIEPRDIVAEANITQSLALKFVDNEDGGVTVLHGDTGETLRVFDPGRGGFVRIAMRAVVRSRKVSGIGPQEPFHLMRTEAGQVLLVDHETGKVVTLGAFGAGNAQTFAQLFDDQPQTQMQEVAS